MRRPLLGAVLVVLSTSCGASSVAVNAFPTSNAHLASAGSGAARAGFGVHAVYGGGAGALPIVQGIGGLDLGKHYALHAIATSAALGVDGVVLAVNTPSIRVGLVHGVRGAFLRSESIDILSGGFSVGPSLSIGDAVRGFAALRYDGFASRTKLRGFATPAENSSLAKALTGSLGLSLDGAIKPAIELGFSNPVSPTAGERLLFTLGVSFIAELPQ